ncbi:MAG: hypothetical protein IT381_10365 [Deltaproteobacteria bacterium]|nr:hypothetical protein [Deltaproteobacteria bacterium]
MNLKLGAETVKSGPRVDPNAPPPPKASPPPPASGASELVQPDFIPPTQWKPLEPGVPNSGHALQVVGLDRSTTSPSLICRNPWGSTSRFKDGDAAGWSPPGTTWRDTKSGLVAIPLTPENEALIGSIMRPTGSLAHRTEGSQ